MTILAFCLTLAAVQGPAGADADGLTPLMRAAARGDVAAVTSALDAADVNTAHAEARLTPLMFAAYFGHDAVVRLLLDKGAAANLKDATGASAADWASTASHEGTATILQKAGAQLNPFLNVGVLPFGLMDKAAGK